MRVELTKAERFVVDDRYSMGESMTLAWRAFGKAIGTRLDDPIMVIDGDGSQFEPITRRYFYLEEARGDRFLSLGHYGAWDRGAIRSLSPSITYISYSVAPDWSSVDFHGWHRPREASRIIPRAPDGNTPFMGKDGLSSMAILIGVMRRRIAAVGGI